MQEKPAAHRPGRSPVVRYGMPAFASGHAKVALHCIGDRKVRRAYWDSPVTARCRCSPSTTTPAGAATTSQHFSTMCNQFNPARLVVGARCAAANVRIDPQNLRKLSRSAATRRPRERGDPGRDPTRGLNVPPSYICSSQVTDELETLRDSSCTMNLDGAPSSRSTSSTHIEG
jgi:hypothetical protein